jgi:pantoate--beta-alanine ligase
VYRVGNAMSRRLVSSRAQRPQIIHSLPALARRLAQWRAQRQRIGLVPTMGALHAGHLALVRRAQRRADRVIVSIFVNPTQFAPSEDLKTYPRTFEADVAALARVGADLVWAPSVEAMYPQGFATRIVPEGPATVGLEDAFRPHFFAGVATVVAKLFIQCDADIAAFGEKDYQQLKVVTQMVRDLDLKTRIVAIPTVRERDGLALSSRNAYLSAGERATAPTLHRVLVECGDKIARGQAIARVLSEGRAALGDAGFIVDYLEARNADTLTPAQSAKDGPLRLLVAARLGKTRLIDNIAVQ